MPYFYEKNTPKIGDVVIVRINNNDKVNGVVECSLPEYDNKPGSICRAKVGKKGTTLFRGLKNGELVPALFDTDDNFGDVVNLSYCMFNKTVSDELIANFKMYNDVMNFFVHVVSIGNKEYEKIQHNELLKIPEICENVNTCMELFIHKIDKLQFITMMKENIDSFYNILTDGFNEINKINPNLSKDLFVQKIFVRFPPPYKTYKCNFTFETIVPNGIDTLKKFISTLILSVQQKLAEFGDENAIKTVSVCAISIPKYEICFKSNKFASVVNMKNMYDTLIESTATTFCGVNSFFKLIDASVL